LTREARFVLDEFSRVVADLALARVPRRKVPDPIAFAVGQRIRQLRLERGLTAESLAFGGELSSKGFMSDIERGLARPSLGTLKEIAALLGVALLDLVTFPADDERQALIDQTRHLPRGAVRKLLKELAGAGPRAMAANPGSRKRAAAAVVVRGSSRTRARTR
jgi:transcriptional regulator with XRE-family HTH domain